MRVIVSYRACGLMPVLLLCLACGGGGGSDGTADTEGGTATIGVAGGMVTSEDRTVTVTFPANALAADQTVSIVPGLPSSVAADIPNVPVDTVFTVSPAGLALQMPATVKIDLGQVPIDEIGSFALALTDDSGALEFLGNQTMIVDYATGATFLRGRLTHLSTVVLKKNIPASAGVDLVFSGVPASVAPGSAFKASLGIAHPATSPLRANSISFTDSSDAPLHFLGGPAAFGALQSGRERLISAEEQYSCQGPPKSGKIDVTIQLSTKDFSVAYAPYFGKDSIASATKHYSYRILRPVACPDPAADPVPASGVSSDGTDQQ